ncbi:MAG TPA: penicillin acylase family protein [Solirubrobacteraceae bacterium]|nr:penicillin acylase family protein [Solirubrobacteraceae bacterium]
MLRVRTIAAAGAALLAFTAAPAAAAPTPQPYGFNGFAGFRDVLPPGSNGLVNAIDLAQYEANNSNRPAHNADQRDMYANLVYGAPNIGAGDLPKYYKDSTFGVRPEDVASTTSPRDDVTIVRDRQYGIPHVYGSTRAGAEYGLGYAAAQDRLFFIDILRHLGRAQLSAFAGGAAGNRSFDRSQWAIAPYNESDLQRQFDLGNVIYGAQGAQLQQDALNYIAGINQYISEAKLNPLKMPAEYAAINRPLGPDPWKVTDLIATASLVGGIFGRGGGAELEWSQLLQSFQKKFGAAKGRQMWLQLRAVDDPQAPTTVHNGRRFPYRVMPRKTAAGSVALPDQGSVTTENVAPPLTSPSRSRSAGGRNGAGILGNLPGQSAFPRSSSNALLVSGRYSKSGHPLAVFGPQVAYFAPEILMEQDVHAPTLDAKGAAFPGVNLYVQIGHGADYAWSATSAGQDITDTFAVDLCEPNGGTPTKSSNYYMFRGQCLPMEQLTRTNSWSPNLADSTPSGSETLTAQRTRMGLLIARATIGGKPVGYTKLRSTYYHEVDSALGFSDLNNPDAIRSPQDFQHAVSKIGYTFNWFYADNKHIAYFNSGNNPERQPRLDPTLPVRARFEWPGYNADINTAGYTPFSQHPQVIDQDYLTSWNNKQAPGYGAPDTDSTYTSIFRSQSLDDRVKEAIRRKGKIELADLVNAMGDAATVDLRGTKVLPYLLKVIGKTNDRTLEGALNRLRGWEQTGAHRRDLNRDGSYDDAAAIQIMDAWWPLLSRAVYQPLLGSTLYQQLTGIDPIDNHPNNGGDHLGSAWDVGFYGSVQEDLINLLKATPKKPRAKAKPKRKVKRRSAATAKAKTKHKPKKKKKAKKAAPKPVIFCGAGNLARCRTALLDSLRVALNEPRDQLYHDPGSVGCKDGDQMCFDSISFRALGAVSQPLIPWVNRPTYQQAVEVQGHR